jgi:AcrR family transcriptional regulator
MAEKSSQPPPGETREQRSDARRNYRKVLDAATVTIGEEGTQASLRKIARNAGVGLGTLYRHFPTRDALIEAVLRDAFDRLATRAETLAATESPRTALTVWLQEFTVGAAAFKGISVSLIASLQDPASALYAPCRKIEHSAARLVRAAQHDGTIRDDVTGADLIALAGAIATINEADPSTPQRLTHLLTIAIEGLNARDSTETQRPAR